MKNDRDRDFFINIFWQQRDPTPGTPENEVKNEIESRFQYANKFFGRGAGRPGWMTDMGKIHIILGKANSIERFESKAGLYPAQVWYYYGDKTLGLPTYFNIVFYQPQGVGEWKLYNQVINGPAELIIDNFSINRLDYEAIYKKILELAPTLAQPAISMIPNEIPNNHAPTARANFIMNSIFDSPIRKINPSYATNFLKYKGFVNVDSSINFIENSNLISVSRHEMFGFNMVNISVKPKKISVGFNQEKDQYFFNFNLSVSLKQGEDKTVYQYAKNFEFYINPDQINALQANGVVIHDSFPVIPGQFQVMVYLENSVGKEFSYFEAQIAGKAEDTPPFLAAPILGFKAEVQNDNFFYPYKYQNKKLFVDTEKVFSTSENPIILLGICNVSPELWDKGKIEMSLQGLNDRNKFNQSWGIPIKDFPMQKNMNMLYQTPWTSLRPDYYELTLKLLNQSGRLLDSQKIDFSISPLAKIGHPQETFKRATVDNPYFFYYTLAVQYENTGDTVRAELYYEKCTQANPDFMEGWLGYLRFENKIKKYEKVLSTVEKLKKSEKHLFDYHFIKGAALFGQGDYPAAQKSLMEANKIYNSDIRLLNLIGFTFLKMNDLEQGLKAFEASLILVSSQPVIQNTIEEIKKKLAENVKKKPNP